MMTLLLTLLPPGPYYCWPAGSVQVNLLYLPFLDCVDSSSDIASVHFTEVFFVCLQLIAVDLLPLFKWVLKSDLLPVIK